VYKVPFDPFLLMHAAALLSFIALAFRDQLKLRAVLLVSIFLEALFHIVSVDGPSWQEVFWNVVTFGITLAVLIQIAIDRSHFGLTQEQKALFDNFPGLTPGEFRVLLRVGRWCTATEGTVLTQEGVVPDNLYYVLTGRTHIRKGDREIRIDPKTFIGEIAFLHGSPASATVTLEPGARYYEWPVAKLKGRINKHETLTPAMTRLIGLDMALKVARS